MTRRTTAAQPPIPQRLPTLSLATAPSKDSSTALCGATSAAGELFFVGGLGANLILRSTNGRKYTAVKSKGRGLRGLLVDEDRVWAVGEYGGLYHSAAGLGRLARLPLKTGVCLFSVAKAPDGSIWVGGDGFLARSTNGTTFKSVSGVVGLVGKMLATPDCLYIPTMKGLWRAAGSKVTKLGLSKPAQQVLLTRAGTLLVVCAKNAIFRSVNGETFRAAAVPPFKGVKLPRAKQLPRPYWFSASKDLNVAGELADGRLVVAGDQGVVLSSSDDGATFRRVPHALFAGSLWAVASAKGELFFAGENRVVLRAR